MRIGDLHTAAAKLIESIGSLELAWESTTEKWNDDARRRFDEDHLSELAPAVQSSLGAINRLADVLARAQRECEDTK